MATEAMPSSELIEDIEVKVVGFLATHMDDRYLTRTRIALALGVNELLLSDALKNLRVAGQVVERVDKDWGATTYHYQEPSPNTEEQSQIPKVVTLEPTVTEKDVPAPKVDEDGERRPEGMSEAYWCSEPDCKRWFDTKIGRANHLRFAHGIHGSKIARRRSKKSVEIDEQIKKLYPQRSPSEIASDLGISYPKVTSRLNKMHEKGEIRGYMARKDSFSRPPETIEAVEQEITPVIPQQIQSIPQQSSFNIGQLLKVNSENQVAIVNATLEVIDERGSQYQIAITRTGKGVDGRGPIPMEFSKDVWKDLVDLLEWHGDAIRDLVEDSNTKEDNPEWYAELVRQYGSLKLIVANVRRDAGILKEKEGKDASKDT